MNWAGTFFFYEVILKHFQMKVLTFLFVLTIEQYCCLSSERNDEYLSKPFVTEWKSHAKKFSPKVSKLKFFPFIGKSIKKKKITICIIHFLSCLQRFSAKALFTSRIQYCITKFKYVIFGEWNQFQNCRCYLIKQWPNINAKIFIDKLQIAF